MELVSGRNATAELPEEYKSEVEKAPTTNEEENENDSEETPQPKRQRVEPEKKGKPKKQSKEMKVQYCVGTQRSATKEKLKSYPGVPVVTFTTPGNLPGTLIILPPTSYSEEKSKNV